MAESLCHLGSVASVDRAEEVHIEDSTLTTFSATHSQLFSTACSPCDIETISAPHIRGISGNQEAARLSDCMSRLHRRL
jgi:hypothetical protein